MMLNNGQAIKVMLKEKATVSSVAFFLLIWEYQFTGIKTGLLSNG